MTSPAGRDGRGLSYPPNFQSPTQPLLQFGTRPQAKPITAPKEYKGVQWDGGAAGWAAWKGVVKSQLGAMGLYACVMKADFHGTTPDGVVVTTPSAEQEGLCMDTQSVVSMWLRSTLTGAALSQYQLLEQQHEADHGTTRQVPTAYEIYTRLESLVDPAVGVQLVGDMLQALQQGPLSSGVDHAAVTTWLDGKHLLRGDLAVKGQKITDELYLSIIWGLTEVNYKSIVPGLQSRVAEFMDRHSLPVELALKKAFGEHFPLRYHGRVADGTTSGVAGGPRGTAGCTVHRGSINYTGALAGITCFWCSLIGHRIEDCQIKENGLPKGDYSLQSGNGGDKPDGEKPQGGKTKYEKEQRKKYKEKQKIMMTIGKDYLESRADEKLKMQDEASESQAAPGSIMSLAPRLTSQQHQQFMQLLSQQQAGRGSFGTPTSVVKY